MRRNRRVTAAGPGRLSALPPEGRPRSTVNRVGRLRGDPGKGGPQWIIMDSLPPTPLIRLGKLCAQRDVYGKCEFLAPSGCFKIRGATHLLEHLRREGRTRHLIVPSMGNTALGAAVAAQAFGFRMTGVVPE